MKHEESEDLLGRPLPRRPHGTNRFGKAFPPKPTHVADSATALTPSRLLDRRCAIVPASYSPAMPSSGAGSITRAAIGDIMETSRSYRTSTLSDLSGRGAVATKALFVAGPVALLGASVAANLHAAPKAVFALGALGFAAIAVALWQVSWVPRVVPALLATVPVVDAAARAPVGYVRWAVGIALVGVLIVLAVRFATRRSVSHYQGRNWVGRTRPRVTVRSGTTDATVAIDFRILPPQG